MPSSEPSSRRMSSGGGGPVIEYVRGPMRIAMAPVASANPNDAGVGRLRRGKKMRRWDRGGGFREGGPRPDRPDRPDRYDNRGVAAGPRPDGFRPDGPRPEGFRPPQPWQGQPSDGANGMPGERRRRRRRRRRRPGDGPPMQGQSGFSPGGNGLSNGGPGGEAPVSFFAPVGGGSGPIMLGPDGQPLRKRRRRRRRGRGGRQREWRMQGGEGGGGGGEGGGGGPPPPAGGGSNGGDGGL
jgi:hypothetical protein